MKIADLLRGKRTLSFEVFPPKPDQSLDGLLETLNRLYAFAPDFISCTYGAGGGNQSRNLEVCEAVQASGKAAVLSHYTCIGSMRDDICRQMDRYVQLGIENILALRGDYPPGACQTEGDFSHADELLCFLKERYPSLCYGVACYPETHVQALSQEADLEVLKRKQACGAEFCTTQLCYSPEAFDRFRTQARRAGVTIPILVGVMPVVSIASVERMTSGNGCSVPAALRGLMERFAGDAEAFRDAGADYTAGLIDRYLALGVDGLHVYSMNRHPQIEQIFMRCKAL